MKNVVLIGMPGAGKSTIGVVLAKVLGYQFVDADLVIQKREGKLLRQIIAQQGEEAFIQIEGEANKSITGPEVVIATGGSVVYHKEAMEQYQRDDLIVYIQLSYETVAHRLSNLKRRGVVLKEGQTLKDLYEERVPLYENYAHITVNAEGLGVEELMDEIARQIQQYHK